MTKKEERRAARRAEKSKAVHRRVCACGASYKTEAKRGRPFPTCPKCRKK
jgi:hypothetical protein